MKVHDSDFHFAVSTQQQVIFTGLIRIHVMVDAEDESLFGPSRLEELKRHGYRIGLGLFNRLLHGM